MNESEATWTAVAVLLALLATLVVGTILDLQVLTAVAGIVVAGGAFVALWVFLFLGLFWHPDALFHSAYDRWRSNR